jgi:hypothetical protein
VQRDNQTFIGLRLDPLLLEAVDKKRALKRLSRSQFIRDAIFEAVADMGVDKEIVVPPDRVGIKKGGRPKSEPVAVAASSETPYHVDPKESKRKKA